MRIGIVGLGVAGSYLASRLGENHQVVGLERAPENNFDAVCAWGTCKQFISNLVKPTGLNFENYVIHDGYEMLLDTGGKIRTIGLKGLCTYNKLQLIRDLLEDRLVKFNQNVWSLPEPNDFDLAIDSTGLHRPLLPKIKNDVFIPAVQYKVKYRSQPFDDFYIKPFNGLSGYFWYFPLGDGYAHIGAGDYHKRHNEEIADFMRKYPGEVLKKVGRPIRLTPPSRCEPFYQGKVVGVGESIGTVYPVVGEGIIPSLQCAELLVENLDDLEAYRQKVLEKFAIYEKIFKVIMAAIEDRFSMIRQLPGLLGIFFHMKQNEDRYGLQVRLSDILKVAGGYKALKQSLNFRLSS
ncbi:MAG: NAD(P)/FAD-dependent oxidoreductase [Candidatus Bathyarchaeia archaeon]